MNIVELSYPIISSGSLPLDNAYPLYGAISNVLGDHLPDGIAIAPLTGFRLEPGKIRIDRDSRLRIRTPSDHIGTLLGLSGRFLNVAGLEMGLGIPNVHALTPAPTLSAKIVTIKGFREPDAFLEAARRQLDELGVTGEASIPLVRRGPFEGKPLRQVVRVKGKAVVGFGLVVSGLSPEHSITLLARGLGGRRHMGCGIFVPIPENRRAKP